MAFLVLLASRVSFPGTFKHHHADRFPIAVFFQAFLPHPTSPSSSRTRTRSEAQISAVSVLSGFDSPSTSSPRLSPPLLASASKCHPRAFSPLSALNCFLLPERP